MSALVAAFGMKEARSGGRKPCPVCLGEAAAEALLHLPGDQAGTRGMVSAQPGWGSWRALSLPVSLPSLCSAVLLREL